MFISVITELADRAFSYVLDIKVAAYVLSTSDLTALTGGTNCLVYEEEVSFV